MRRTTILNAKQVKRTSFSEAEQLFTKHCKLKNLSPQTMRYYAEDLKYFHACVPVQYVDEVSQDAFENFIVSELDAGKKITSLNSRIRGLRVFFKFCAEREYMKPITLKLMKEDEIIKEPYTDAELRRLLKRPEGNSWVADVGIHQLSDCHRKPRQHASECQNIRCGFWKYDNPPCQNQKPQAANHSAFACAETNFARLSENVGMDNGRLSVSIERGGTA